MLQNSASQVMIKKETALNHCHQFGVLCLSLFVVALVAMEFINHNVAYKGNPIFQCKAYESNWYDLWCADMCRTDSFRYNKKAFTTQLKPIVINAEVKRMVEKAVEEKVSDGEVDVDNDDIRAIKKAIKNELTDSTDLDDKDNNDKDEDEDEVYVGPMTRVNPIYWTIGLSFGMLFAIFLFISAFFKNSTFQIAVLFLACIFCIGVELALPLMEVLKNKPFEDLNLDEGYGWKSLQNTLLEPMLLRLATQMFIFFRVCSYYLLVKEESDNTIVL